MQDILATAIEMHRTGQLAAAVQLYQAVLALEQENADALHLLGVLNHQQGNHTRAVELIGRAVAVRPNAYIFHANLAEAYRALGQFDRAAGCCRASLQLWPDYPEALCNLGAALQGMNQQAEAAGNFRRALELRPDFAVAHNNLAIALRELGQLDEAFTHFQRAAELDPTFAMARSNLGQMLLDRGQAEEALAHCQEAVRLAPNVAALRHNLGNALRGLEKFVEARAAYLEALRLDPKLAMSHAHLGLILQREGKYRDALPWLKQSAELEPANAQFWENLGELHGEMEEFAEAIPFWRRALALDEKRVSAHLALGWALQEEGSLTEAAEHFRTAAQLQPDSGMAQLNLGGLHEELGQLAEAEATFRKALELQPKFAIPHARLATLLRGKLSDSDLAALEQRLTDETLGEGPRARLLFSLAHVLDARGDFDRAAECLRQANAMTLELARERRDYNSEEHQKFVDRLLAGCDREFFRRLAGAGSDSRRPVFVFGLPRSGTTLVEQVLASHSRIYGAGELRFVRQSFEKLPAALGRTDWPIDCVWHSHATAVKTLAAQHLDRLHAIDARADRIVDKMPDNYMYLGFLAAMFPQAVFIHCRRDLRDTAVSCWMTDFRSIRWANDCQHIADRFREYGRLMEHWRKVSPAPIHDIDYEETVNDLETVARRMVEACGLEWEPACLEYHKLARPVRTASVTQVRQPVYTQSVARWKNYERELGELFAMLPSGA
jgi:tetratricopeptide (TPR) repeat protein